MPRVRLFAGLREVARTSELEIDGATVGEVLEAASSRFGAQFAEGLATAKIWRNGEEVDTLQPVGPEDEIALLPPVSGGSVAWGRELGSGGVATLVVVAALALGNMVGEQDLWTPILAAMVGLWTFDVVGAASERGHDLAIGSILGGQIAAMALIHLLGRSALPAALAMGVIFPLGAATFVPRRRQITGLGIAAGVGVLSCGALASLMLARAAFEPGGRTVGFFLLVMVGAIILAEAARRMRSNRLLNRQNTVVIAVVAFSIIGAGLWGFSLTDFLLIGFGLSAAYLAGEGFGTVLRSGRLWSSPLPGILSSLDGPLCAGLVFFALLTLIL